MRTNEMVGDAVSASKAPKPLTNGQETGEPSKVPTKRKTSHAAAGASTKIASTSEALETVEGPQTGEQDPSAAEEPNLGGQASFQESAPEAEKRTRAGDTQSKRRKAPSLKAPGPKATRKPREKAAPLPSPAPAAALVSAGRERLETEKGAEEKAAPNSPDFERLAYNAARLVEQGGKALAACLQPMQQTQQRADLAAEVADAVRSFSNIAEHWLKDPTRAMEAQTSLANDFVALWAQTLRRLSGGREEPVVPNNPADKRFAAPEWRENPLFDFLRQAHSIASRWADDLIERSKDIDPHVRNKAKFYLKQISSALAPSNFIITNPEVLKETWASSGDNLVRGASFLARDIEAGKGTLKISRVDDSAFELGVNVAATPGKVVFRNDLIELIQYAPTTAEVYKRPLLIIPPWINKFYILDLNPEKSFVRWATAQGLTVFIISWVNPDERHRDKGFEDYMREGIFAALDAIEKATGEKTVSAIGYCIGGTLLAMTLAYLVKTRSKRVESAAFFTTQVDFSQAGDLKLLVDPERLRELEKRMAARGYLEASAMAASFNMLRPDELIWSYVVNNYMKGKPPIAFDLLAWNSDSTRMPAANHMTYLRDCYLENKFARGQAQFGGKTLELAKVKIPIYHLATREDHIAPARSVFLGAKLFGGDVRFVLAGSGHIAGVINPAGKPKYPYWTGPRPAGEFENWMKGAIEHEGSWWTDWLAWITAQAPEKVPARQPGEGKLPALCDAPGQYVRVKY